MRLPSLPTLLTRLSLLSIGLLMPMLPFPGRTRVPRPTKSSSRVSMIRAKATVSSRRRARFLTARTTMQTVFGFDDVNVATINYLYVKQVPSALPSHLPLLAPRPQLPFGHPLRNVIARDFLGAFRRYDPRGQVSDVLRDEYLTQAHAAVHDETDIIVVVKRALPTRLMTCIIMLLNTSGNIVCRPCRCPSPMVESNVVLLHAANQVRRPARDHGCHSVHPMSTTD